MSRICVVTGANTGIGKCVASALASSKTPSHVVLACRSLSRAAQTIAEIKQANPTASLEPMHLDLASFDNVRKFTQQFLEKYDRLHVLVNNAGAMFPEKNMIEGIEQTMLVNHLSPFLLTNLLLPTMRYTVDMLDISNNSLSYLPRIVFVASKLEKNANMEFKDSSAANYWCDPKEYKMWTAYANSKRCNLFTTFQLSKILADQSSSSKTDGKRTILVNAVSPGVVNTGLGRWMNPWLWYATSPLRYIMLRSPEHGAETIMYCLEDESFAKSKSSGLYLYDKQPFSGSEALKDEQAWDVCWQESLVKTGLSSSDEL